MDASLRLIQPRKTEKRAQEIEGIQISVKVGVKEAA